MEIKVHPILPNEAAYAKQTIKIMPAMKKPTGYAVGSPFDEGHQVGPDRSPGPAIKAWLLACGPCR